MCRFDIYQICKVSSFLLFILLINCAKKNGFQEHSHITNSENSDNENNNILIDSILNLNGKKLIISNKKLIISSKGSIINGVIIGDNGVINTNCTGCLNKVRLEGQWNNDSIDLKWFIKDPKLSGRNNLYHLSQILTLGKTVFLSDIYPIEMQDNTTSFNTTNTISIKGISPDRSGLILETKHSNQFYNYFQTENGNNIELNMISITSRDYINNLKSANENKYFFCGAFYQKQFNPKTKPNLDKVIIKNCLIRGAISVAGFGSSSENQTLQEFLSTNKVDSVYIDNNRFEDVVNPFYFSNLGYGKVSVINNMISNLSEVFISFPASGIDLTYNENLMRFRGDVVISHNNFSNGKVVSVFKDRVLSPCVIKGGDGTLLFEANKLENLLSSSIEGQVHTFYYTCTEKGKAIVKNNTFHNVMEEGMLHLVLVW